LTGVEQANPGRELGWDVHDTLTGFEEPLSQGTPGTVGSFDGPDSVGPGARVGAHGLVTGLVGGEPPVAELLLLFIDDLDRG